MEQCIDNTRQYINLDDGGNLIVSIPNKTNDKNVEIIVYTRQENHILEQNLIVSEETIENLIILKGLYEKEDALDEKLQTESVIYGKYHEQVFISNYEQVLIMKSENRDEIRKLRQTIQEYIDDNTKKEKSPEQYDIKNNWDTLEFIRLLEEQKKTFSIGNGQKMHPEIKDAIIKIIDNFIYEGEQIKIIKKEKRKIIAIKIIALATAIAASIAIIAKTPLTMSLSNFQRFLTYIVVSGIINLSTKLAKERPSRKIATATTLQIHSKKVIEQTEKQISKMQKELKRVNAKKHTQQDYVDIVHMYKETVNPEPTIQPYKTRFVTPELYECEIVGKEQLTTQQQIENLKQKKNQLIFNQDSKKPNTTGYTLVLGRRTIRK